MNNEILFGDCIESIKKFKKNNVKVQTCITSPPYFGLRSYLGEDDENKKFEIGLEETPIEYIEKMVNVFHHVKDILSDDGTLWINIGDSYAANRTYQVPSTKGGVKHGDGQSVKGKGSKVPDGLKPKDLIGIPWMLAFALRSDGWYLRQDIIWHKPNAMPESVKDRCGKSHEYIFLLSKCPKYYFDYDAIKEPVSAATLTDGRMKKGIRGTKGEYATVSGNCGFSEDNLRNKRSVWTLNTKPYNGAHFAVYPPELITPCILAGSRIGDIVFDPFMGSGTTAATALSLGRKYLGCELNSEYKRLQDDRLSNIEPINHKEKIITLAGLFDD